MQFLKDKYNYRMKKLVEKIEELKNLIEKQKDDFNIFKNFVQNLYV